MKPVPEGEQYGIIKLCSDNWPGGSVNAAETSVAFNKIREQVQNERLKVDDFFLVSCLLVDALSRNNKILK